MTTWLAPPSALPVGPGHEVTFSVIIPTYEMADLVVDAVRSVLEQSRPPHELIVCDDGSTDGTQRALRPFAHRIKLVSKQNGGLASAKNAAAAVATGEFLAILDADDVYLPRRLEALHELASARPDLDLLNTDVFLESEGSVVAKLTDYVPFPVDDQRSAILERNFMWSGAVIRKARFDEHDGFDEAVDFADDWDLWRRLIFAGAQAGLVNEPLAIYRIHANAMSADRRRALAGKLEASKHAASDDSLSPSERRLARRWVRRRRADFRLAAGEETLRTGRPGARRASMAIALGHGFSPRTRAKAFLATLAPRAARRRLEALEHRGRQSRLVRTGPQRDSVIRTDADAPAERGPGSSRGS